MEKKTNPIKNSCGFCASVFEANIAMELLRCRKKQTNQRKLLQIYFILE